MLVPAILVQVFLEVRFLHLKLAVDTVNADRLNAICVEVLQKLLKGHLHHGVVAGRKGTAFQLGVKVEVPLLPRDINIALIRVAMRAVLVGFKVARNAPEAEEHLTVAALPRLEGEAEANQAVELTFLALLQN